MTSTTASIPEAMRDRLAANLARMRECRLDIADAVASARLPEFACATGRDGSETIRHKDARDRWCWFGGSSLPSISADAIVGYPSPDEGSLLIPGILTGLEAKLALARRSHHTVVFVWEPQPASLFFAFCLHDYTGDMASDRLQWLAGDRPGDEVQQFLAGNDGFDLPRHILRVPGLPAQRMEDLQRQLERAVQVHAIHVAGRIEQLRSLWCQAFGTGETPGPTRMESGSHRIMVWAGSPADTVIGRSEGIRRALQSGDWDYAMSVPDRPGEAHVLARLRLIESMTPTFLLYLGAMPEAFRRLLPQRLPVVHWCAAGDRDDPPPDSLRPCDFWLTASESEYPQHADRFRVQCLDAGVATDLFHPPGEITPGDVVVRRDSAVPILLELPSDDPSAYEVGLTSHVNLWHALCGLLREDIDSYSYETAGRFLSEAERASGVNLSEDSIRTNFVQWIRKVMAPAAMGRACMDALREKGLAVVTYGSHWGTDGDNRPALQTAEQTASCLRGSRVAVFGACEGLSVERLLQAAACGSVPICYGSAETLSRCHPRLDSVIACSRFYHQPAGLVAQVQEILSLGESEFGRISASAARAAADHSVSVRLGQIAELVDRGVPEQ